MRDRRAILTHILMVVAPLVMLAALTAAWFINSNTAGLAPLSFASQNTGPGAALHFGTVVREERSFDGAVTPNTLKNTVLWGKEERTEDSAIVIQHMVPGQCEYYLLVSDHPITVSLTNVVFRDAAGEELSPATGADLPLAQCLGFYLIPVSQAELEGFDWDKVGAGTGAPVSAPTLSLVRDGQGQLVNAALKGAPPAKPLAPEGEGDPAQAYILAVYCDPVYLQTPVEGTPYAPINTLEGSVSFSLAFPKEEAA